MNSDRKIELLQKQIDAAQGGQPDDVDSWRTTTEVVVRNVLGAKAPLHEQLTAVHYGPMIFGSEEEVDWAWYQREGVREAIRVLEAAKVEVELAAEAAVKEQPAAAAVARNGSSIFIVHGHDTGAKESLARFLHALTGSEPTILHEQANGGRTLIEKFEHNAASAAYAVVLLTADDVGRAAGTAEDQKRARQNVVLELGFFFGALGRERVAVLYDEGVELPSDLQGLVYIQRDAASGWKMRIAQELAELDISVDWSALRKG